MEALTLQQLEKLKYCELQHLAKSAGLKANLKADKLLKALKQHFYEMIQENGDMVSTDTKELGGSQIPPNVTFVTQRCKKKKEDDDQGNPELCPEKEIFSELKENEEPQDAGAERILKMNQTELLANSGLAKNVATPSQCKEKISAKRRRTENKTLADPLSGKKSRYTASLSKPGRTGFATPTPNFKKLHEAQFKKMQSIDDYIERKTKMIKNFSNSVNDIKTGSSFKEFLLSPNPRGNNFAATRTPASLRRSPRHSVSNGNKSILTQKSLFNSNSLSAIKMNVRFSEATKDNEHKRSLIKTPSRKSPFLNTCTPDSQKTSVSVSRKNFRGSTTKCQLTESSYSAVTLKSEVQTAEPTSTKKPTFDLKASLSRPLSYQPHKGKLKPWGKSKENIQNVSSHKRVYKQPVLTTREERRERHEEGRKLRKDQALGIRRGLILA